MLRFVVESRRIAIDGASITLAPLLEIWMADKSKDKRDATPLLTYIHLCAQIDPSAPYYNADPGEVDRIVKNELFGDYDYKFENEEKMEEAIFHYQGAYESPEMQAVRSFDRKIHEMRRKIDATEIEVVKSVDRGKVTFVSNAKIVSDMMKDIEKIIKSRDALEASTTRKSSRETLKGNRKMSFLERQRKDRMSVPAAGPVAAAAEEEEPTDL